MTGQPSLFDSLKSDLQIAFDAFDAANPAVYRLFCRFTHELIARGWQHGSADAVIHRIRWEVAMETTDPDWKLNNNFCAGFARKFAAEHPEHRDFFRTRRSAFDGEQAA